MKRSTKAALAVVIVLGIGLAIGGLVYPSYAKRREVVGAVSRYNIALTQALANLDETPLHAVAGPDEITRVTTYMLLLNGTNTDAESSMLSLRVRSYVSAEPTYTVTTQERWRYAERDSKTGQMRGKPVNQTSVVRYTLIDSSQGVIVYRSDLITQTVSPAE